MSNPRIGFVGLGRLGLPLAQSLLDAGYDVVCASRGRSGSLVARGAKVAGDGSARAVAEAADIVVTCLPSVSALEDVITGPDGLLSGTGAIPPVIELSTLPPLIKWQLRQKMAERGGDMLDAPVSGTPPMAAARIAVIYASGNRQLYDRVADVITTMSPNAVYVGPLGAGVKFKFIAQFLATIHVTAAIQAMAYAKLAGLDLDTVAKVISASPGAMSGQFNIRAPMIAAGDFDGQLVTVDMTIKDVDLVLGYGEEIGAPTDLLSLVGKHFHAMAADGEGSSEPAKLFLRMLEEATPR